MDKMLCCLRMKCERRKHEESVEGHGLMTGCNEHKNTSIIVRESHTSHFSYTYIRDACVDDEGDIK